MEDLPHAARAAESTIAFTTQLLRDGEREAKRERHGGDITIFLSVLL